MNEAQYQRYVNRENTKRILKENFMALYGFGKSQISVEEEAGQYYVTLNFEKRHITLRLQAQIKATLIEKNKEKLEEFLANLLIPPQP